MICIFDRIIAFPGVIPAQLRIIETLDLITITTSHQFDSKILKSRYVRNLEINSLSKY